MFEAAHEYGHALQNGGITPIVETAANATECQSHNLGTQTNYQCAYIEGFADYHAVAVWGSAVGDPYTEIDQGWFVGFPHISGPIGPTTEGAIASTMLRWADGTGQRVVTSRVFGTKAYTDNVAAGNSTIADAMRNCRITRFDFSAIAPDGIDYLAYCMEKNVYEIATQPCAVVSTGTQQIHPNNCGLPGGFAPQISDEERLIFIGLRSNTPHEMATIWSCGVVPGRAGYDGNVRQVWMCNLFYCL